MGTVMLLSIMGTTLALSLYFMWKAFKGLSKQALNARLQQIAPCDGEADEMNSAYETLIAKP